jgi:hypothetical protein
MTIRYCRENGYGNIDVMAPEFQLGRRLHEAQVLLSKIMKGEPSGIDEVKDSLNGVCQLIARVGELRADYSSLLSVIEGQAVYEYSDKEGRRWEVKRQRVDMKV